MHGKSTIRWQGLAAGMGLMAVVVAATGCGKGEAGAAAAEVATPAIEIGRENIITVATGDISVGPLISGELARSAKRTSAPRSVERYCRSLPKKARRSSRAHCWRASRAARRKTPRSAQSMVHSAEEALALAERELARTERLVKGGALAERDLESARNAATSLARSATMRRRAPCRRKVAR